MDRDHIHMILDVGSTKKGTVQKYLTRNLPTMKGSRFRTVWPKSMNHHINQMIYIRTNKHGHGNPLLSRTEAKKLKTEIMDLFPQLKKQHKAETKRFLALIEAAKQKKQALLDLESESEYEEDSQGNIVPRLTSNMELTDNETDSDCY